MKSKRWSVGMILAGMALIGSMAVAEPVFPVKRGTNISHWLSQSSRRGAERAQFFTEKDVQFLAGVGFDHLRIPIDEEQMWDEAGAMEPEAFALLNSALDWCETHGLRAIVDLHILRSHHFNDEKRPLWTEPAAQERFFQCWRDLSSQLSKRSVDRVAYELMNEPVADDPNDWNRLVAKAVGEIRKLEPKRVLVIGSNRWQSTDTFDQLRVPAGDPNIMLSFHMYEPFALTHHQASWTGIRDYKGPVHYPGITVRAEDLEGLLEAVASDAVARSACRSGMDCATFGEAVTGGEIIGFAVVLWGVGLLLQQGPGGGSSTLVQGCPCAVRGAWDWLDDLGLRGRLRRGGRSGPTLSGVDRHIIGLTVFRLSKRSVLGGLGCCAPLCGGLR